MTINEFRKLKSKGAKQKYGNTKTVVDGMKFDSIGEANRYNDLKILERAGMINNLRFQVPFELIPKNGDERPVKYIADFQYNENGKMIVEDFKGFHTKEYILKRKLLKWRYPDYAFRETTK